MIYHRTSPAISQEKGRHHPSPCEITRYLSGFPSQREIYCHSIKWMAWLMAYGSTAVIFTVELGPRHRDDNDETSRRYRPQSILPSDLFSNTRPRSRDPRNRFFLWADPTGRPNFFHSSTLRPPSCRRPHLVCVIARLLITIFISSVLFLLIESESPFFPPMRAVTITS